MKILLYFTIVFGSCITIAPERTNADHYEDQKALLNAESSRIKYIEIDQYTLEQNRPKNIYLFATWCPHCITRLKNNNVKSSNIDLMLVSANYDIKGMERFASPLIDTIYILANSHYGSIEKDKVLKFSAELTGERDTIYGLPKIFELKSGSLYHLRWDN